MIRRLQWKNIVAGLWQAGLLVWLVSVPNITPVRAQDADMSAPSATIEIFHDALDRAMKRAGELGYDGRHDILAPVIATSFDTSAMVRVATGRRNWNDFSEEQKKALIDAFTRMTIAAYAGRFNDYSGQYFETLGEEPGNRDRVLVKTKLVKHDGEEIAFDYLMHRRAGDWAILDVYLKGTFSELAVRRSEFSSVLRDSGYAGLMKAIEDTIAKYREG